jgi:2,4-dienoyl-CoA reductase-like NADH-dependent reductase (Old Yellow Enzyme family)
MGGDLMQPVVHPALEPGRLGPLALRNRVVKAATYEAMTPGGLASERLVAFHRAFAAGGVAMSTVAYCAVTSEGRTFRDQLWARDEAVPGLRAVTDAIHAGGAAAALQLGHAGWFADPRASGVKPLGPSRMFSAHGMCFSRAMGEADIDRVTADYARAARFAVACGFDAIEVHVGHGYLLSQFLSPYTNRRRDRWGGSIENRARFPRQALRAVREAVGERVAVYAKLNMHDGFEGGLTLEESLEVARLFEADGALDAIELTGGFTARSPMYLFRGEAPRRAMAAVQSTWLRRLGTRLVASHLLREHPFQEAFFLPYARQYLEAVGVPLMLLGGVNRLATMDAAIAEGFSLVAMARALLREPDLVARYRGDAAHEPLCVHCNLCVVETYRGGARCVLVPAASSPAARTDA